MWPIAWEPFILVIAGIWIALSIALSRAGGWAALAAVYRASEAFEGERWRFQSAGMRWGTNYGSCLTVGADAKGLHLAVPLLFRIGHPPLFIPWTDISVTVMRRPVLTYLEFRFRRAPAIPLRVGERLGRRIAAAAGQAWPGESPS
ncbi:MAG TPA: hypothetical protein VIG69_07845 [Candidatus Methylomirabilis sp.]|jgi:hypothetical protein